MRYGNMEQRCRSLSVVKDDSLVLYVLWIDQTVLWNCQSTLLGGQHYSAGCSGWVRRSGAARTDRFGLGELRIRWWIVAAYSADTVNGDIELAPLVQ